jgi:hypothetical protein
MKRVCKRCDVKYSDGGPAGLPFCRRCISTLPDDVRRGINNNAPGTRLRDMAVAQARRLWNMPEYTG